MLYAFISTEIAQYAVRIGAGLVGAIVGWFAVKPLANMLSRLAFQRPIANELVPLVRVLGAAGLAVVCYILVPAGTGMGGDGPGDGTGIEKDKGGGEKDKLGGKVKDKYARDTEKDTGKKAEDEAADLLRVEILGGERYPGNGRWYLFQEKDPPLTHAELKQKIEEYLKDNKLKSARLQPVITGDTIGTWMSTREPELRQIRLELGLQPVDPRPADPGKEK